MTLKELIKCLPYYQQTTVYVGLKYCSSCRKVVAHCSASKLRDEYGEDSDEYKVNRIEAAEDSSLNIYVTHIDKPSETYSPEEIEDINRITGFGKSIIEHAEDIVKESRDYPTMTECDISMDMNLTNKGYIPTLTLTRSWIPEAIVNR
jgi:hypothetical protein